MEVHFSFRQLGRAADHTYYDSHLIQNHPGLNDTWELWHLQC